MRTKSDLHKFYVFFHFLLSVGPVWFIPKSSYFCWRQFIGLFHAAAVLASVVAAAVVVAAALVSVAVAVVAAC